MNPILIALQYAWAWTLVPAPDLSGWRRHVPACLRPHPASMILVHAEGHRIQVSCGPHAWIIQDADSSLIIAQIPHPWLEIQRTLHRIPRDPQGLVAIWRHDLDLCYGAEARARLDTLLDKIRFLCCKAGVPGAVRLICSAPERAACLIVDDAPEKIPGQPLIFVTIPQGLDLTLRETVLYPYAAGTGLCMTSAIQIDPLQSAHAVLALLQQGEQEGWPT